MQGTINIGNDATLQQMLTLMTLMPEAIVIHDRVYCQVPKLDYEDKLNSDIGDGRKLMSSEYKNFAEDDNGVYVLVGENTDTYGADLSGSRDLVNNPVTKEEFVAWVTLYGVERFHVDFPRLEVE